MCLSKYSFSLNYGVFNFAAKITSVPCKLVAKYTSNSLSLYNGIVLCSKGRGTKIPHGREIPGVQLFNIIGSQVRGFPGDRRLQPHGRQINQGIIRIIRCEIRGMMRSGKREMGHTADIAGMLVGITGTMAGFSFRMHMRRSAGFHVRTDTERFVVMMVWKNSDHQYPQTDKQQAICIYTMFHSLSLTGTKVKRNTEKNNALLST